MKLESGLEYDLLLMLERDPTAAWFVPPPARLGVTLPNGRRTIHTPDLLMLDTVGRDVYKRQGPVAVNPTLQSWVVLETPFRKPHLTAILRKWEKAGAASFVVRRPPGKKQFAPGVTVELT